MVSRVTNSIYNSVSQCDDGISIKGFETIFEIQVSLNTSEQMIRFAKG